MFSEDISEIENTIVLHHEKLNDKSLWVFVAAMATWSITKVEMQLFAHFLIFTFFCIMVYKGNKYWKSFSSMYSDLRKKIQSQAPDDKERDANLYRLDRSKKNKLSWGKVLFRTFQFNAAFVFFLVTMLYQYWPLFLEHN